MIIGIGIDILNLERLKKIMNKYDQKYINRIYGKNEIEISKGKLNRSLSQNFMKFKTPSIVLCFSISE